MSENEYPEFIVSLALNFKAIRVVGNQLVPTTWNIKAEVLYDEEEDSVDDDVEAHDLEIRIAIAKIKYWLENTLNGSVIFDAGNEWASLAFFDEEGFVSVGNNNVILPAPPTDDLIAEILHSKMNAFGGKFLQFGVIELSSDDKNGLSYLFTGDGEINLPEMGDWVGETAYFDKPWWARPDASTYDVIPGPEDDLTELPASAYSLDFIRQSYLKQLGKVAEVVKPQFRPTVVKGGLDETT